MPTMRNDRTYTARRDALKRKSKAIDAPCHLCLGERGPIRYESTDPRDPFRFTADHVDAVAATGGASLKHGRLMPSHATCNSSRGAKTVDAWRDQRRARTGSTADIEIIDNTATITWVT